MRESWPTLTAILGSILVMTVFLAFRKRRGKISNWDVSVKNERARNIYSPVLILVLLAAAGLHHFQQPFVGETLFFALLMAVCFVINTWIKISQHTLIITYLGFLVLSVNCWAGLLLLALAPFVAWSRVVLGRHQKDEVLAGGLVAVIFGLAHIWIFG